MSTLIGVEIYIITMQKGIGDATITIDIRESFKDYGGYNKPGEILATTSQPVADGYDG